MFTYFLIVVQLLYNLLLTQQENYLFYPLKCLKEQCPSSVQCTSPWLLVVFIIKGFELPELREPCTTSRRAQYLDQPICIILCACLSDIGKHCDATGTAGQSREAYTSEGVNLRPQNNSDKQLMLRAEIQLVCWKKLADVSPPIPEASSYNTLVLYEESKSIVWWNCYFAHGADNIIAICRLVHLAWQD